jgi:TolA-binding protein
VGGVTRPPGESNEGERLAALADLARDAAQPPTPGELDRGLHALRARIAAGTSRRRALVGGSALGVAAALLVAVALRLTPAWRGRPTPAPPPVQVARIDGGALLDGGYLAESGHAGITLAFNEGTEFRLRPGTRGRLREVARAGADLAIEEGVASFRVTPNPAGHWSVEAGPFLVTVKGTVFDVAWDPKGERFELALRRGRVVVSGPVVGEGLPLRAGQRLVVRLPRAETVITEDAARGIAPAAPDGAAPPPAPPARAAAARRRTVALAALSSPGASAGGRDWAALVAAGQWDRVLADADREGVDTTLGTASSEDLFALADAARYRRRVDLARAALLAQRRRFPRGARALDAIFLLGRVEELRAGGAPGAIAHYDEYLARAPAGAYAAEALGRKMVLTNDVAGAARARPLAEEYLLRFPGGSYAGAARALARAP